MKDLKYGPSKLMEDFVNLRSQVLMLVWSLPDGVDPANK